MAYSQKVLAEEDFGTVKVELLVDSDGKFSARDAVSKEGLPVGLSKNLADLKKTQVEDAIEKWKEQRVLDVRAALAGAPKLEGAPKKKGRG